MKYITLANTDITCSALCLGTPLFGSSYSQDYSFAMLDRFAELGGNIIDTAHVYANWISPGRCMSEKTIGKWLTARGMHGKMHVSTKGGSFDLGTPQDTAQDAAKDSAKDAAQDAPHDAPHDAAHDAAQVYRVNAKDVLSDIKESLDYLQTDCLEIYWLHRDNLKIPVDEILGFLNEYKEMGLIKYFGGSNWTVDRFQQANTYANSNAMTPLFGLQNLWSLARPNYPLVDETMVACEHGDIEFLQNTRTNLFAYSSLAFGFFGKLAERGYDDLDVNLQTHYYNEENMQMLEKVKAMAVAYNCSINNIALAYLLSQDFTCIPVIGCSNLEQLESNIQAVDIKLTPKDIQSLGL